MGAILASIPDYQSSPRIMLAIKLGCSLPEGTEIV